MPASDTQRWWESQAHRLMGFFAGLVGMGWLLHRREIRQLPPATEKKPQLFVGFTDDDRVAYADEQPHLPTDETYWNADRVMDTLTDLGEKMQGMSAAAPFTFALGVLVGWMIWSADADTDYVCFKHLEGEWSTVSENSEWDKKSESN